jgi:hypothetical protein
VSEGYDGEFDILLEINKGDIEMILGYIKEFRDRDGEAIWEIYQSYNIPTFFYKDDILEKKYGIKECDNYLFEIKDDDVSEFVSGFNDIDAMEMWIDEWSVQFRAYYGNGVIDTKSISEKELLTMLADF